jgi:rfaE bifunctional protein kinase chain/domain/rfaE bifunctional protein nucleotidyltransferase chain/domain
MNDVRGSDVPQEIKAKIIEPATLRSLMGKFENRKETFILCHGVFDVMHPGHIRHLEFAKSQADFLIVSLTADEFITKGVYRPHVSEEMRALSLAHLHIVDYVVINRKATPDLLLKDIQPDFFAKGFEYVSNGLRPATESEVEIVKSYGGNIVFTPGDLVYSSSKLIDENPPNLKFDRINLVMKSAEIDFDDLLPLIDSFRDVKVLVVGDTIVDTLIETYPYGNSQKTPTISVLKGKEENFVGGAAIVALHLKAAGADVDFVTVLGEDEMGSWVKEKLEREGVRVKSFSEIGRCTTRKTAYVCQGYRLLKVDEVDNRPITQDTLAHMIAFIEKQQGELCLFSDFRHGIFNRNSIDVLTRAIRNFDKKVADSQVASRWGNVCQFKNFSLITPNEREARFSLGDQDSTIHRLAINLRRESGASNVIIKLGERGLLACSNSLESPDFIGLDAIKDEIVDAVGSGDALLAYSSLTLVVNDNLSIASLMGSLAAGVACTHNGNVPVTFQDVKKEILSLKEAFHYSIE